jgi:hypothetical protein
MQKRLNGFGTSSLIFPKSFEISNRLQFQVILKQLRGRRAAIHIEPYKEWMQRQIPQAAVAARCPLCDFPPSIAERGSLS